MGHEETYHIGLESSQHIPAAFQKEEPRVKMRNTHDTHVGAWARARRRRWRGGGAKLTTTRETVS